jgi:hypothetical protein
MNAHPPLFDRRAAIVFDRLIPRIMESYGVARGTAIALVHLSRPRLAFLAASYPPAESFDAPEPAAYLLRVVGDLFDGSPDDVFLWDAVAEACRRYPGRQALVERRYPGIRCWRPRRKWVPR